MEELILCNRKETDVPYYLEQNMINIYSLEELNWYILNHTEYLDDSFVSDDLISWIAEELKDRELAGQLKEAVRKKMTLAKKVRLLMDACGFCTKKEKDEIEYALAEVENKSEIECMKIRADRSLMNHRYVMAIREYMRLLQKEEAGKLATSVIGNIWNNIGVAHTGLFLYRDAARCFKKAYDYNNNPACMREMEEAWRMAAPDEKEQVYEVSEVDGRWTEIQCLKTEENPSFQCFDNTKEYLYSVHGDFTLVSSYKILEDGTLEHINTIDIGGKNPVDVTVDAENQHVIVATLQGGTLYTIKRNEDGSLGDVVATFTYEGKEEGKVEGKAEGILEGKMQVYRNLLKKGFTEKEAREITEIS